MNKKMRDYDRILRDAQFADEIELQKLASKARFSRARAFSVSASSCGAVEVIMRGDTGHMWYVLSPQEAINTVHQLASAIGLTAHLSERDWLGNHLTTQITHLPPTPPMQKEGKVLGHSNGETLAIEAPKQRRKSKRAAATT